MTLKLKAIRVDPVKYAKIMQSTKDIVSFHFVYAALHYYFDGRLEGVNLTLFKVVCGNDRLYCVIHEILGGS
jgi:hypothetical protein